MSFILFLGLFFLLPSIALTENFKENKNMCTNNIRMIIFCISFESLHHRDYKRIYLIQYLEQWAEHAGEISLKADQKI